MAEIRSVEVEKVRKRRKRSGRGGKGQIEVENDQVGGGGGGRKGQIEVENIPLSPPPEQESRCSQRHFVRATIACFT